MERMSNIKVMETDNYSQFKKLLGNREVTQSRINTIKESILRIGYQPSPILVNEKKEVIDGQGRLAACEKLNLPIYFIEKKGLTIDDCISMNKKMESWKIKNYINSYTERKFPAYIKLSDDLKEYKPLTWEQLLVIKGRGTGPSVQEALKDGKLQYIGLDYIERERARWICALIPYIKDSGFSRSATIDTLIRLDRYKLIDKARMLESFEKYGPQFGGGTVRAKDVLQGINALYNYNRRKVVFFADDYRRMAVEASAPKKANEQQR